MGCRAATNDAAESSAQGITDTEITIAGSFPFSGPTAVYGTLSQGLEARLERANAEGGIDGREIRYQSADDGYEPARAVTNARRFVQQDQVFALVTFGGPPTMSATPIAQEADIVQIAIAGNGPFSNTDETPNLRSWFPSNPVEAEAVTSYLLEQNPDAKIGTLVLNNDTGMDYLDGIKSAVEKHGGEIVLETVYEGTDATVDSQVNQLRAAGVDTVVTLALGAIPFQMTSYMSQIGWHPAVALNESSTGLKATIANMEGSGEGAYSAHYVKDPYDPRFADDPGLEQYREDIAQYGKGADPEDFNTLKGYGLGEALIQVLSTSDLDTITTAEFFNAWDSLPATEVGFLLDGLALEGGEGGRLLTQFVISRLEGESWVPLQ
nr:ABC transporter substrate-binding protein [Leucobacter weissii]